MRFTLFGAGAIGGNSIVDSFKDANVHMKNKGGLGVTSILLQAGDVVDFVKIVLPSPAVTKHQQEEDNWGEEWVSFSQLSMKVDSNSPL